MVCHKLCRTARSSECTKLSQWWVVHGWRQWVSETAKLLCSYLVIPGTARSPCVAEMQVAQLLWWSQRVFGHLSTVWVPALAGKQRQGHSVSGWTRGVQVKLWDPLRTRAIPERLRGVSMTRCYTNPRLPLPLPLPIFHVVSRVLLSVPVCKTWSWWTDANVQFI